MVNKLLALFLTLILTMNPISGFAQEQGPSGDLVDESLRDITIVLGTGAVGAVLGLSTLSFVDEPKDHLKNISIGGAIGIVVGVGVVIFSQATRSQTTISDIKRPLNEAGAESLSRFAFVNERIAAEYHQPASAQFNFSF